ncbi:2684_t:CDS:10, partial [Entrophospora sp. SA101]
LLDNKKKDLIYTKCYCEENIYHLCKEFLLDEKNEDYKEGIYVCFISNEDKVVPLFRQSSSELENGLVLWIDKDGMWNSPPPNYPPISNQEFTMNLDLFISMTENLNSDKFGKIELHNPLRCEENMTKFKDFLNQIKYDGPILASTESIKLISKLHYHPKLECILSSILPLSEIKVSSFEDIDDIPSFNIHILSIGADGAAPEFKAQKCIMQTSISSRLEFSVELYEKKLQIKDEDDTLTLYIDKNSDYNLKRKISQESSTEEINDPKIIIQKAINTKIQSLQEQLESLKSEESLKDHYHQLHNYNEIKDIGQMLFGKKEQQQKKCTRNLDST